MFIFIIFGFSSFLFEISLVLNLLDDSKESMNDKDEDIESGNGPSLAQSPVSEVETSACIVNSDPVELNYIKLVVHF